MLTNEKFYQSFPGTPASFVTKQYFTNAKQTQLNVPVTSSHSRVNFQNLALRCKYSIAVWFMITVNVIADINLTPCVHEVAATTSICYWLMSVFIEYFASESTKHTAGYMWQDPSF